MVYYFPRSYIDRSHILDFSRMMRGDMVTFIGKISRVETAYGKRRKVLATVEYHGWVIHLVFFSAIYYYQKLLKENHYAAFSGKIDIFNGRVSMVHPVVELFDAEADNLLIHTGKIIPIYRLTESMKKTGISNYSLREANHFIIHNYLATIKDNAPAHLIREFHLPPLLDALRLIHYPESMEDAQSARERHAFDEIFRLVIWLISRKNQRKKTPRKNYFEKMTWREELKKSLPFKLTGDQSRAIQAIENLMEQNYPYNVLLQGDVGSGKTLVALFVALTYMENGHQVALLAPTEILARQHYQTILSFTSIFPLLSVDFLTGKEKTSEKEAKADRISRGDNLLIIGTHAILQKNIEFRNLGLVIIDEQHRFGVDQREALIKKGKSPDIISMSATPIPRSLTLALYGDLETIQITEKPANRGVIETKLFEESQLPSLYKGVKKYVDRGRQVYIIYPIIEDSDKVTWASIQKDYYHLENDVFPDYRLGLLHGRLNPMDKENAMQKFKDGEIQILISTTVIEVGIDVPNATVMLIRNAEKFGLAQLHQLRGRVGRGEHQSFCILVRSGQTTPEGVQRLEAMLQSNDGFYLARKDLEIRGTGDLIKTENIRQSGASELRIADIRRDERFIEPIYQYIQANFQEKELKKNWMNPSDFIFT